MHPLLVDLDQARADTTGDRAADILDPDADVAEARRQMTHQEPQSALGEEHGVERGAGQADRDQDEEGGGEQQKSAHRRLPRCHSFGEKLM